MVTIGFVLYNEEKHIDLLRHNLSLLFQNNGFFSVIVINNGSTDKTEKHLQDLAGEFPISLIHRTLNNLAAARQKVVELAQTEWVGFVDGDCVINTVWLNKVLERRSHLMPNVAAFGGPWKSDGKYKPHYEALFSGFLGHFSLPQFQLDSAQVLVKHIPTANIIYRRESVLAVGGFRSAFEFVGEDLDLSVRLLKANYELIMCSDMPIQHYLPDHFLQWFYKIFNYGCARVRVAWEHKTYYDRILILPVLFFIFMTTIFFTKTKFIFYCYFLFILFYAWVFKKKSNIFILSFLIIGTQWSYAIGMVYQWSCIIAKIFGANKLFSQPIKTVEVAEKM